MRRMKTMVMLGLVFLLTGCGGINDGSIKESETAIAVEAIEESLVSEVVSLPGGKNNTIEDMVTLQDGTWVIWETSGIQFRSEDEGKTWETNTNISYQEWYKKLGEPEKIAQTAISTQGSVISGISHFENTKEDGTIDMSNLGNLIVNYYYENYDGEQMEGSLVFPEQTIFKHFCFLKK